MAEGSFYKQNTMPDLISGEEEPPLPLMIGPYKVESLLSKGGMSLLYLGLDPQTKKDARHQSPLSLLCHPSGGDR